jgi:beta-phosphoglucomutase-like phosphatase (HAD superfamily)
VAPGRSVALEDSPTGITSAHAAGCTVVAVPSVPPPPGLAQLTVSSLRMINLATLREAAAGRMPRDP